MAWMNALPPSASNKNACCLSPSVVAQTSQNGKEDGQ